MVEFVVWFCVDDFVGMEGFGDGCGIYGVVEIDGDDDLGVVVGYGDEWGCECCCICLFIEYV